MSTDTQKYKLNHTMLRVKDPKESTKFYSFLGLSVVQKLEFPESKFDLYFLGFDSSEAPSRNRHWTDREGLIELTHNYGTELDDGFKIANGNSKPGKGFGHVAVSVDNIHAACQRIEDAGYSFQKKLNDGRMKSIAFALDPDGYWVELLSQRSVEETAHVSTTILSTYRMNHSMIRVKDPEKSVAFYKDVMGMQLKKVLENKESNFNLYFLGYGPPAQAASKECPNPVACREGLLELTWNYGTENDNDFKYHDGNSEPKGFGHICISVDNLDAACSRLDECNVQWKKRLTDGKMKDVAFVLDPDGYWIEIIQNEALKKRVNWSALVL